MESLVYAAPIAGVVALGFAYLKSNWVNKQDPGDAKMVEIGALIREGAMAFLAREYKVLAIFVLVVGAILAGANLSGENRSPLIALSFVLGAVTSGLAGYFGMRVATAANTRTTAAARKGLAPALEVAFSGGSVMGMSVVGLALVGLGGLYVIYTGTLFPGSAGLATS